MAPTACAPATDDETPLLSKCTICTSGTFALDLPTPFSAVGVMLPPAPSSTSVALGNDSLKGLAPHKIHRLLCSGHILF